jgi:hypothetical protein
MPRDGLVFVATQRFIMHLNPYSRNAAQLDNPGALYASDRPRHMLKLIAAYPKRTPYLELTSNPALGDAYHHPHPDRPTIHVLPMTVLTGTQFAVTARVRATSTKPIVVSMFVDERYVTRVLASSPSVGQTYETTYVVGEPTASSSDVTPLRDHDGLLTIRTTQTDDLQRPFAAGAFQVHWYSTRPVDGGWELLTPVRQARVHHDRHGHRVAREVLRTRGVHVDVARTG